MPASQSESYLYHVTTHPGAASVAVGDVLRLDPGPQGAEGKGVYFSEGKVRVQAADAVQTGGKTITAIIAIRQPEQKGVWYRAKNSAKSARKGARTWHTNGHSLDLIVKSRDGQIIFCDYALVGAN